VLTNKNIATKIEPPIDVRNSADATHKAV